MAEISVLYSIFNIINTIGKDFIKLYFVCILFIQTFLILFLKQYIRLYLIQTNNEFRDTFNKYFNIDIELEYRYGNFNFYFNQYRKILKFNPSSNSCA